MSNNSYSSGPNSGYMYKRSGSNINEDHIPPEESSPSFPTGGMNSFPHQEYQYGPREVPPESYESYSSTGPGSMSDLRRFQPSDNRMNNRNSVLDPIGEAPAIDGVIHNNGSKIELGSQYDGDKTAPGFTGLKHENHSTPSGEASSAAADGEVNPADYVGISLVGKKFKEVNPTAYYVEKDDDDLNEFM